MRVFDEAFGKRDALIPYFDFIKMTGNCKECSTLREIHQLRYEVYCVECAYLDATKYENGLETDEYDDCSVHFAAYADDRNLVGTVRLVQPEQGRAYPFEDRCAVFDDFTRVKNEEAVEISRLVVKKTYRRRRGDSMEGISKDFVDSEGPITIRTSTGSEDQRVNSPLLLLGLYREMYRHSCANGIRYWYAAMERSLARSLNRMGIRFVPIGPQVDYYGRVTPYIVDLHEVEVYVEKENEAFATWFKS